MAHLNKFVILIALFNLGNALHVGDKDYHTITLNQIQHLMDDTKVTLAIPNHIRQPSLDENYLEENSGRRFLLPPLVKLIKIKLKSYLKYLEDKVKSPEGPQKEDKITNEQVTKPSLPGISTTSRPDDDHSTRMPVRGQESTTVPEIIEPSLNRDQEELVTDQVTPNTQLTKYGLTVTESNIELTTAGGTNNISDIARESYQLLSSTEIHKEANGSSNVEIERLRTGGGSLGGAIPEQYGNSLNNKSRRGIFDFITDKVALPPLKAVAPGVKVLGGLKKSKDGVAMVADGVKDVSSGVVGLITA